MADDNSVFGSFSRRFARDGASPAPAPAAPALVVNRANGEREPYEAFGVKDKAFRFEVRCVDGLAHSLPYNYLLNVTYNRRTFGAIFLTVSGTTVTIKGRALRPIIDALKLHTCEFIQAFTASEFEKSEDPEAPLVESIDVDVIRGPAPPPEVKKA